ncbi:hypothetical protein PspR76_09280 [Pseudomonas sp. R76]|nr:hypothetical protein PspR76_09280 [Pseudomonas sp. R76]
MGAELVWELVCVGAGLPAMQPPRSNSYTELMLSRASPTPTGVMGQPPDCLQNANTGFFLTVASARRLRRPL